MFKVYLVTIGFDIIFATVISKNLVSITYSINLAKSIESAQIKVYSFSFQLLFLSGLLY